MLSAILYGLRISLSVGVTSTIVAFAIGLAAGLAAAYFGGRTDTVIMRIADIQLSFPAILRAQSKDPLRIGCPLPLTGPFAALAADMQRGAQLAEEQLNAAGGVGLIACQWLKA